MRRVIFLAYLIMIHFTITKEGKNEEMLDWFDSGYFYAGQWPS